jgi:hypothetical protein
MISDTMGSTETDSTGDLHKMQFDPEHQIYAVCANRVELAAEMLPLIREEFSKMEGPRSHGNIWMALNLAVWHHRSDHFKWDILNTQFSFSGIGLIPEREQERMIEVWRNYEVPAQLLIGTFDDQGLALLYFLGRLEGLDGLVHLMEFPGYFAIGVGSYNANFWLNYRRQVLGMNVEQSALHAYEASRMASTAPTVNRDIEVLMATAKGGFHFSREVPNPKGSPVSLPWLVSMAKKYGPRNTGPVGFPSPS